MPRYSKCRVGAAQDLIAPMNPSFLYPYGDVCPRGVMEVALADPVLLAERGRAARMETSRFEKYLRDRRSNPPHALATSHIKRRASTLP